MQVLDAKKLEQEELERYLDDLELEVVRLQGKIERAAAVRHQTGRIANPVWFAKTKNQIRSLNLHIKRANRELSRRKRGQAQTFDRAFVNAARSMLQPEMFQQIQEQAASALEG